MPYRISTLEQAKAFVQRRRGRGASPALAPVSEGMDTPCMKEWTLTDERERR